MSSEKAKDKVSTSAWFHRQRSKFERVDLRDTPSPLTKGQILRANVMSNLKQAHPNWGRNQLLKATDIQVAKKN